MDFPTTKRFEAIEKRLEILEAADKAPAPAPAPAPDDSTRARVDAEAAQVTEKLDAARKAK